MDCSFLADRWMKLRVHLTDLVKLFLNYNFKKKVSHTQIYFIKVFRICVFT